MFFLFLFLFVNVSAEDSSCNPTFKLISQDPNPAGPGDYVRVLLEVSDFADCDGLSLRLDSQYPFSLDENDSAIQTIESNPFAPGYKTVWTIPYKVRIDSSALNGDYSLTIQYHPKSNAYFYSYSEKEFNIIIQDSLTNFDAVIQEASGEEVSIAIANIGKYTANSVVVRIPEQESFSVSGTDGQMVGNLESGDYTIVGFTISNKELIPNSFGNAKNNVTQLSTHLKFDIYYTDNIGERRVANMSLPLRLGNSSITNFVGFNSRRQTDSLFSGYKLGIVLVIILGGYFVYRKYPDKISEITKKVLLNLSSFKQKEKDSFEKNVIPEWVQSARERKK